nr:hypothetical protein GCM10020092_056280 [Actinoplanes digitatis]
MPSGDEMRALATAAVGGSPSDVDLYPWRTAANGPVLDAGVTVAPAHSADRVRDALAAAGWRTTTFEESTGRWIVRFDEHPDIDAATGARLLTKDAWVPVQELRFRATKGGLTLSGAGMSAAADARYGVVAETRHNYTVWAGETAAVRPLTVAGFLAGAVAGWLVAAAFAYRLRRGGRSRRRVTSALVATAFAAAVVPAYLLYNDLYRIWSYDTANPNPYIVDGRAEQLPPGLAPGCVVAALVALAAALLIARRGARTESTGPEPVTGGAVSP